MTRAAWPGLDAVLIKKLAHFSLDIALSCPPGEMLALVGPSGSGKTTALRCLAGLETPDAGEVRFDDELWSSGRKLLARPQARRVGLLSQDALLFPHMTVLGNVRFAQCGEGDPMLLLQALGVDHLRERRPHQISGGERQRVALCQVLARRPRLLLLDEPFSALDVENRLALRERLQAVREEQNIPVVHVTHDLAEAMTTADRVVSLRAGREDPDWLERQLELMERSAVPAARWTPQTINQARVCAA